MSMPKTSKKTVADLRTQLEEIAAVMDNIINDTSVPRNIRKSVSDAKEKILSSDNPEVALTSATYNLDEALNDINMPFHTRTELISIMSELERLREGLK
jgi:uncharacterized protein (UPF0147 family)